MRYRVKDGKTLHYPDGKPWAAGGEEFDCHDAELQRHLARSSKVECVSDGVVDDRSVQPGEYETRDVPSDYTF